MNKLKITWSQLIIAQTILLAGFLLYACNGSSTISKANKNMEIKSFDGLTIIVKDLEAQRKFYRDTLGLEIETEYSDAVFFKIGEKKLGLFAKGHHKEGDESLEGALKGISHFEFGVTSNDYKEYSKELKDAGFHAYRDIFKDADGNLIEFNLDGKVNY